MNLLFHLFKYEQTNYTTPGFFLNMCMLVLKTSSFDNVALRFFFSMNKFMKYLNEINIRKQLLIYRKKL